MKRAFLFLFVLLIGLAVSAQEVRTIDGRKFIVHKVQQGQTLFALSRSYAVPVEEIVKANPGAEAGLSIDQEILIPQDAINKKEAKKAPTIAADGELIHTVQRKETLFGIAKKYDIDINVLLQRNPALNEGLRDGMSVVIPVSKVIGRSEAEIRPAMPERLLDHIVQPKETLYSLSKLYVTTPEAILAANDGLPEGLKAGSTIKIPLRVGVEAPKQTTEHVPEFRERYQIGYMLPFSIGKNDSLMAATAADPQFMEASRIAAQFYGGSLIALDSLKKSGLHAEITVFDQGDEARIWNSAIKQPEVKQMDLFIGPFHRSAIEQLVQANNRAHVVCPVPQTNKLLLGNPTVSKATPTRSDLVRHTARYVGQRFAKENIIFMRPEIITDKDLQDQMIQLLQTAISEQPTRFRDSVLVMRQGRTVGDIAAKLDPTRMNVIVGASEDVEFVTALVHKLKPLANKHRITLVGLESWLNMETLAATDLDLLNFMFAAGSFTDPEDPRVKQFAQQFRDRFNTEPDEFAFLGFDISFFYLKALMLEGTNFWQRFNEVHTEPLQTGFRMTRTGPENGFRNEYAVMLQQKDLKLQKAP
jgi:LysM repeat protein